MKIKKAEKSTKEPSTKQANKPFFTKLDFLIIGVILSVLLSVYLSVKLVFQKEKYITVEMVTSGGEWWWGTPHPFYWNILPLKAGDTEYDLSRKPMFEILDIKKYSVDNRVMGLIRAKVRVKENKITKTYSFKQTRVEIGKTIGVSLNNISVIGQVMAIDGISKFSDPKYVTAVGRMRSIRPEEADNIVVGDTIKDYDGHIIAEILDKKETPAVETTVDWSGNILKRPNPVNRDVDFKFRVEVRDDGYQLYYQYYQVIKDGISVRLELPHGVVEPYVFEVVNE